MHMCLDWIECLEIIRNVFLNVTKMEEIKVSFHKQQLNNIFNEKVTNFVEFKKYIFLNMINWGDKRIYYLVAIINIHNYFFNFDDV